MDARWHCEHIRHSGHGWLVCVRCGATCTRNNDGLMVKYDRDAKKGAEQ